jgi:DNA-binding response OmpR family regulator
MQRISREAFSQRRLHQLSDSALPSSLSSVVNRRPPRALVFSTHHETNDNTRALERKLNEAGCQTRLAPISSRTEAHREATRELPDIVIIETAGMDAGGAPFELARWLRSEAETFALPVALVFERESRLLRESALKVGVDDYFPATVSADELRARIEAMLWRVEAGRRAAPVVGEKTIEIENFLLLLDTVRGDIERGRDGALALVEIMTPRKDKNAAQIKRALNTAFGFLKLNLRRLDSIGFYGPTTLLIYLPHRSSQSAFATLSSLREEFLQSHADLQCDLAVGISAFPADGRDAETIISNAEMALNRARYASDPTRRICAHHERAAQSAQQTTVEHITDGVAPPPSNSNAQAQTSASAPPPFAAEQANAASETDKPREIIIEREFLIETAEEEMTVQEASFASSPELSSQTADASTARAASEESPIIDLSETFNAAIEDESSVSASHEQLSNAGLPSEAAHQTAETTPHADSFTAAPSINSSPVEAAPLVETSFAAPSNADAESISAHGAPEKASELHPPFDFAFAAEQTPSVVGAKEATRSNVSTPQESFAAPQSVSTHAAAHDESKPDELKIETQADPFASLASAPTQTSSPPASQTASPKRTPQSITIAQPKTGGARGGRAPRRLLLVVSNQNRMAQLNLLIRASGFETRPAFDGVQGLNLLRIERPDVLIVDYALNGTNGFDIINQLWRQSGGKIPLPVVLLLPAPHNESEAQMMTMVRRAAHGLGVQAVVGEPFNPNELIECVRVIGTVE